MTRTVVSVFVALAFLWTLTPPVRGKYRLLASLRCEGTVKEGKLGSWGVYDRQSKKSLKSMVLNPKDFTTEDGSFDRRFRWIDLGGIDSVPGAYFWFAHGHNPALDAIFVDRVVLINRRDFSVGIVGPQESSSPKASRSSCRKRDAPRSEQADWGASTL